MDDYIVGEPMQTVTLAFLKPGVQLSVLSQPLPDIRSWLKSDFPFRVVTLRRAWIEPSERSVVWGGMYQTRCLCNGCLGRDVSDACPVLYVGTIRVVKACFR